MSAVPDLSSRPAWHRWRPGRVAFAYILLLALFAVVGMINSQFLHWDSVRVQLILAAFVGIAAIGQTLAILIGQIDLSIPWTITASAIVMGNVYNATGSSLTALLAAAGIGLAVGLLNGVGVALFRVNALIWTISVNLLVQGATLIYTNTSAPSATIPPVATALASGRLFGLPAAFITWAALSAVVLVVLHRTVLGRRIYAQGTSEEVVLMSGLNPLTTIFTVFVISGLCAALVGAMLAGYSGQTYLGMGNPYLLIPIAAVVLGGTSLSGGSGGYLGTVAGVLIMILLDSLLASLQIGQGLRSVIFGAIVIVMLLLFRPRSAA
ncbi:ABC transporter permease [Deinococcus sp. SM5_A1]|uniref:ABC transporter permease n=1 Tax=Deinococcus sp. SM5_A1 TaxID=3379094 RepID=UPI00385A8477